MSDLNKLQELAAQAAEEGATLKNVELARNDEGDLVLQAIDGAADFEVSIPEAMQISVEDIDFETGQLRAGSAIEEPLRGWFNAYLTAMVDDEDRAALVAMRKSIDAENLTASNTFRGLALGNFVTINTKPEAINRALMSSSIVGTQKGAVLVPILGLARAGMMGLSMSMSAGGSFRSTGRAAEEIRLSAGRFDALHALNAHGQVLDFTTAFSLPAGLQLPNEKTLSIARNFSETQMVGKALVPKAWEDGKVIRMSYCPVGIGGQPRMAREVFRAALKHLDLAGQDMIWGSIRNYNMSRLFQAYVKSNELKDANLRKILSQSIRSQIETMLKSI